MKTTVKSRSLTIAIIAAASVSLGGWAVAQRNDANSQAEPQSQSRGWTGQMDQGLVDQIAADGIVQMNKGQIELANFALKHTQDESVRKFAQASIENCTNLNNELDKFVKSNKEDATRDRSTATEDRSAKGNEPNGSSPKNETTAPGKAWASNWNSQNLNVIRHDISNQVVANIERELAQYQGLDFDRAFLGQQFWGHVTFVAVAKASGKQVSSDLRNVIVKATTGAEKQLDECRKLIRELQSNVARNPETTPRR